MHLHSPYKYFQLQAWILAPEIRQYPAKIRVMSDKSYFKTGKVAYREVKKNYKFATSSNSEAFGKDRPFLIWFFFLFINILIDNLLMQFSYIQNRKICLSKNIYTSALLFLVWFFSHLPTFPSKVSLLQEEIKGNRKS